MIYSLPYILIIVILGVLAFYHHSQEDEDVKKNINFVCMGIIIFFFGFRGFICDDWITYYPAFQKCDWDSININLFDSRREYFEPGFMLLMNICKSIYDDFQFLVFVCTCINTALLYRFLKKRISCIPLGFLLYLCFGGYLMNTNLMRNSIAILVFINSLEFIEERRPLPYFLLCLLALSFHVSAILYFPLYFFFHMKCNKWLYLAIFVAGNIIFLMRIPILLTLISHFIGGAGERLQMMIESYTEGDYGEMASTISIGYLERLLTGILIFCYYEKLSDIRQENGVFINAFIGYFVMTFFLSEFLILSQRLAGLFTFAYWILWYDLVKCFAIENNKRLFMAFLTLYCMMKMVGLTNMKTSEYDNVLFGAKSYEERLFIHEQNDNK